MTGGQGAPGGRLRAGLIWGAVAVALAVPVVAAAASPLLAWRDPVYIASGFAGMIALVLMLVQPLLAGAVLPGLSALHGRRGHRGVGGLLVVAVVVHVAGLWLTSPPDVVDALTFTSPTPFSAWGVIAMWALFATALWAALRRRLGPSLRIWRKGHAALALVIVGGSVAHALLIEGTMEPVSKTLICAVLVVVTLKVVVDLGASARRPAKG